MLTQFARDFAVVCVLLEFVCVFYLTCPLAFIKAGSNSIEQYLIHCTDLHIANFRKEPERNGDAAYICSSIARWRRASDKFLKASDRPHRLPPRPSRRGGFRILLWTHQWWRRMHARPRTIPRWPAKRLPFTRVCTTPLQTSQRTNWMKTQGGGRRCVGLAVAATACDNGRRAGWMRRHLARVQPSPRLTPSATAFSVCEEAKNRRLLLQCGSAFLHVRAHGPRKQQQHNRPPNGLVLRAHRVSSRWLLPHARVRTAVACGAQRE